MPSKRKQINVRISEETERLIPKLSAAIKAELGTESGPSTLFRMGLQLLKQKYLDGRTEPAKPDDKPARQKNKPK